MIGPYEINSIVTGDAKELTKAVPDESVDMIFCDPVYENIDDYAWLAQEAARVLKPDSACLAWIATPLAAEVMAAMTPHLHYAWTLHLQRHGTPKPGKPGICVIAQCLWFEKGHSKTRKKISDHTYYSETNSPLPDSRNTHGWSKPIAPLAKWMQAFIPKEALVFDPFCGGGSIPVAAKMFERNWLGFELDHEKAAFARERVATTQLPLPVVKYKQDKLLT